MFLFYIYCLKGKRSVTCITFPIRLADYKFLLQYGDVIYSDTYIMWFGLRVVL